MTLRLRVDSACWNAHVDNVAASFEPLVPVVKGNGYGFGRGALAERAVALAERCHTVEGMPVIAVGTVHELTGMPSHWRAAVLTPAAPDGGRPVRSASARLESSRVAPIVTVGAPAHIVALEGWAGAVAAQAALVDATLRRQPGPARRDGRRDRRRGAHVVGYSIHLPLAGDDDGRLAEIGRWLGRLESTGRRPRELWVSHLAPAAHAALRERWPAWTFPMRSGTALWHGDKAAFHLGPMSSTSARCAPASLAGYHGHRVPADGTLVMVGAGTAHGVAPLDDGRSPFHFVATPTRAARAAAHAHVDRCSSPPARRARRSATSSTCSVRSRR